MDKVVAHRLHFYVPGVLGGQSTRERKCAPYLHPHIAGAVYKNSVETGCSLSWRRDHLSSNTKAPFFKQVSQRIADNRNCDLPRDGWSVCAGDGRAAHMPRRNWATNDSPPRSGVLGYANQLDVELVSSSLLAVVDERATAEDAPPASRYRLKDVSAPADSDKLRRQNVAPAEEGGGVLAKSLEVCPAQLKVSDPWSFQAEDFEWEDRRDPITNFRSFGEAVSTSYSRIWFLRKKHGVWFAADQERHPKPLWSLDDPDYDGDMRAVKSSSNEAAKTEMPGPSNQASTSDLWLLDSSFLVALLDSNDLYSTLCLHAVDLMGNAKKVVSPECISEATQLIRSRIGGLRGVELELFLYECIERGTFEVIYPETIRELNRFIRLKDEFMESDLGPTAAAIIALSKQLSIKNVATLDRQSLEAAGGRCNVSVNFLPL